ncbi:MAG: hypothetical protein JSW20_05950 [Nitrospiraceae bacterium]|nr:MAG: hypothetical protein JSW20_05950 [Nitrospiraceae bacterium]
MMRKERVVMSCVFVILIACAIVLSGNDSFSEEKKPEAAAVSCITAKCHADMNKVKYVHAPVDEGACDKCHGEAPGHIKDPKKNKFKAIENISKVCYSCHDNFRAAKFTHSPVEEGECTSCHNPHGSDFKFQMVSKGGEVCFECHDDGIIKEKWVHGPAAVGGCIACHEPHVSDNKANLRAKGSELCYMCHTDKSESIQKAAFVHQPVSEDCTGCHNPHSAAKEFMLDSGSPELCLGCHEDKKEQLSMVKVKHGALARDKSCLNCHDAHMSQIAKNLTMEPMDLCLSCHDREYKRENGDSVMNITKWLADNKEHHGPIKQKDCSGCHDPHGSNSFRILRNDYPPTFYKPFAVENYNLCFGCHEKTIALDPDTTKLTNFRNGNQNLHFLHVNKAIKGRTCRACHETHASNFPKHIRESVPFGVWDLPVNYEKTDSGGSCAPGCHKIKKYDRVKKVMNE